MRYAEETEKQSIFYIDKNNLYGACMSQPLPHSKFKFLTPEEWEGIDFENTDAHVDGGNGYIIEASFKYPKRLHAKHRSWPLIVEKRIITKSDLSPYSKERLSRLNRRKKFRETKVTATFHDKSHVVVSLANFQLYKKLGLEVTGIHRVLQFHQSAFARAYIDKCTECRSQSKNDYDSLIFKLLSNALYGKLFENTRNRSLIKFVRSKQKLLKYQSMTNYEGTRILTDKLGVVYLKDPVATLDKPIAAAFSILEYSRYFMAREFYETIQPTFPSVQVNLGSSI